MMPIVSAEFERMRHAMVASQLRTNEVNDPRVVAAMAMVPREAFVPGGARALAYRDTAVPLGDARYINIPIATGRLLTVAYLTAGDRVLLIGAAGGYTAAVLAGLVASVVAVESHPALAAAAHAALVPFANIELVQAPLGTGHPEGAPYDVLVIDGAVPHVPDGLIGQVRVGGRVVTGLVDRGVTRLAAGGRSASGFGLASFADVECVELPGFAVPQAFSF